MQAWSLREPIVKAVPQNDLIILDLNGEKDKKGRKRLFLRDTRLWKEICITSAGVLICMEICVCWPPTNI